MTTEQETLPSAPGAAEAIRVWVVGGIPQAPDPSKRERRSSAKVVNVPGNTGAVQALNLLAHTPNRFRALLTFIGQSTDVVYLCVSQGNALQLQGAPIMCGQAPFELQGSDEWWIGAGAATQIVVGVISEYYAD